MNWVDRRHQLTFFLSLFQWSGNYDRWWPCLSSSITTPVWHLRTQGGTAHVSEASSGVSLGCPSPHPDTPSVHQGPLHHRPRQPLLQWRPLIGLIKKTLMLFHFAISFQISPPPIPSHPNKLRRPKLTQQLQTLTCRNELTWLVLFSWNWLEL